MLYRNEKLRASLRIASHTHTHTPSNQPDSKIEFFVCVRVFVPSHKTFRHICGIYQIRLC